MKRTLTREDFEVPTKDQLYIIDFFFEEFYFRTDPIYGETQPEDVPIRETLDIMKVSHYDDENNLIVSIFDTLPEDHQEKIYEVIEKECDNYAEDE